MLCQDAPVQLDRLLEAQSCCYAQQNSKGLQLTTAARCISTASHHAQSTTNYRMVIVYCVATLSSLSLPASYSCPAGTYRRARGYYQYKRATQVLRNTQSRFDVSI